MHARGGRRRVTWRRIWRICAGDCAAAVETLNSLKSSALDSPAAYPHKVGPASRIGTRRSKRPHSIFDRVDRVENKAEGRLSHPPTLCASSPSQPPLPRSAPLFPTSSSGLLRRVWLWPGPAARSHAPLRPALSAEHALAVGEMRSAEAEAETAEDVVGVSGSLPSASPRPHDAEPYRPRPSGGEESSGAECVSGLRVCDGGPAAAAECVACACAAVPAVWALQAQHAAPRSGDGGLGGTITAVWNGRHVGQAPGGGGCGAHGVSWFCSAESSR
jgi:hypothetical protein